MKLKALIPILCIFCLISCGKKEEVVVDKSKEKANDSLALHVAIFPCENCLPLYYADAKGMNKADAEGISLMYLSTMEDCDTALINHSSEVSASDIARLICMRKDGFNATAIAQMPVTLQLLSAKGKRITEVKQLKERLVAIDRHSESDYYSDEMLKKIGMDRLDIFRTQFNNHRLRCSMLMNALVEAAFLDEPYATLAREKGAKEIWKSENASEAWPVLATSTQMLQDERRMAQMQALVAMYQKAVKELQENPDTIVLRNILKTHYELPSEDVDTIPQLLPRHYSELTPMKEEILNKAKQWLVERKWIESVNTENILTDKAFKK